MERLSNMAENIGNLAIFSRKNSRLDCRTTNDMYMEIRGKL